MSLYSLSIENFQSHEKTRMQLHPRINALVGDSDCGKSAVMRAILWCITNSPQGLAHVSNWAKNKKGDIKGRCLVQVDAQGGVVTRIREPEYNGYHLDPVDDISPVECSRDFEALRTDVPAEIAEALNIGPVNIQRQLDPPFLISATPGEAARYINGLVDLQVIDEALSIVNGMNRDTASELKFAIAEQEKRQAELDALAWVDRLQALAERAQSLEKELGDKKGRVELLRDDLGRLEASGKLAAVLEADLMEIADRLDQVDRISGKLDRAIATSNRVSLSFKEYTAEKKRSAGLEAVNRAGALLDRAGQIDAQAGALRVKCNGLLVHLSEYRGAARICAIDAEGISGMLSKLQGTERAIEDGKRLLQDTGLEDYERNAPAAFLDLEALEGKLGRLRRMDATLQGCLDDLEQKQADLRIFGTNLELRDGADRKIREALESLDGQICPCCGRPMHACDM